MRVGKRSRGYTLVETVIVISIIAVFAGVAAPFYASTRDHQQVEMAARRIAADLRAARSQAQMNSSALTVVFTPAFNSYTLTGVTSLDNRSTSAVVNLAADPYDCTLAAVSFNGTQQVTFDAYGSADNSGQIVVQRNNVQMTVTLEASSGKATVP